MDPQLRDLAVSPSGFVFDPRTGQTCTLNSTGLLTLEALRDGMPLAGVLQRLEGAFDTAGADLTRDVLDFVRSLREAGLVAASFELD